jgi:hypothetical protein
MKDVDGIAFGKSLPPFEPTQLTVNTTFGKRLLAASLDDASRPAWAIYDYFGSRSGFDRL